MIKSKLKLGGILILVVLFGLSFTTCGSGGGGGGGSTNNNSGGDNNATNTPEASATIGPSGGTVEVTNPSSPLFGIKIEIPSNALSQETNITISKAENPPPFPSDDGSQEITVNIGPSGTTFQVPATVTIP